MKKQTAVIFLDWNLPLLSGTAAACQPVYTNCHRDDSIESTWSPTERQLSGLTFPSRHSLRWQHLSSSYTAALHPACLSDCPRALKVSTANSTWALNYLINLGWQGRLKPLCDPQAPHTDISHWTRGRNPVCFFETLKCLTRFIPNPQLYLYRSLPDLYYFFFQNQSNWLTVELTSHKVLGDGGESCESGF